MQPNLSSKTEKSKIGPIEEKEYTNESNIDRKKKNTGIQLFELIIDPIRQKLVIRAINMKMRYILLIIASIGIISYGWEFLVKYIGTEKCMEIYQKLKPGDYVKVGDWCEILRAGGHSGGEKPGSIPNPAVKPPSADDTVSDRGTGK